MPCSPIHSWINRLSSQSFAVHRFQRRELCCALSWKIRSFTHLSVKLDASSATCNLIGSKRKALDWNRFDSRRTIQMSQDSKTIHLLSLQSKVDQTPNDAVRSFTRKLHDVCCPLHRYLQWCRLLVARLHMDPCSFYHSKKLTVLILWGQCHSLMDWWMHSSSFPWSHIFYRFWFRYLRQRSFHLASMKIWDQWEELIHFHLRELHWPNQIMNRVELKCYFLWLHTDTLGLVRVRQQWYRLNFPPWHRWQNQSQQWKCIQLQWCIQLYLAQQGIQQGVL